MTIGLSDYEFQLNNTGVRLNGSDIATPYVDIEKVSGLDSAPYRETVRDHEGQDGGFIDAEFEQGREIALEGTAFGTINNVEPYLDSLKANFGPVTSPIPFYFKSTGVAERVIFVKPRGVRFDWDTARRLGMTAIQFLMYAEDPRIYDNLLQSSTVTFGGLVTTGFSFTPTFTPVVLDTFTRTVSSNWGTSDTLQVWTITAGTAADFSATGTDARIAHTAVNATHSIVLGSIALVDQDLRTSDDSTLAAAPLTQDFVDFYDIRFVDASNHYRLNVARKVANTVTLELVKVVAGVTTTIAAATVAPGVVPANKINIRFQAIGTQIWAKAWLFGQVEPTSWLVSAVDSSITAAGNLRVSSFLTTGNTNSLPQSFVWDNLSINDDSGFAFPINFGAVVLPNGSSVTVSGNRPTPALMTINGPVSDPIIVNDTNGKIIRFDYDLAVGDSIVLDLDNRTAILNGVTNVRGAMTNADWFLLDTGSTFIRFGGASGSGIMTVTDDFEDGDVSDWDAFGSATFVSSAVQAHGGTLSGFMTVIGSPSQAIVRRKLPVTTGQSCSLTLWGRSTAGWANFGCAIDWYDALDVYISTNSDGANTALPAATWSSRSIVGTAPIGAAFARFGPTISGTPTGQSVWIDDVIFAGAATPVGSLTISYRNAWR